MEKEKITQLENRIQNLEKLLKQSSFGQDINRYLGSTEKKIINQSVSDSILDIVWNKYYHHLSFFESIDRYLVGGTTFSADVDDEGLLVETISADGSPATDFARLIDSSNQLLKHDKETRFRTSVKVSHTTNINAQVASLDSNDGSIGFIFINGSLEGETYDGSTSNTVPLGSYTADTYVLLEFHFYPPSVVRFFVNGEERGISTKNLPTGTDNLSAFVQNITTTDQSTARSIRSQYFEIIQVK